MSNDTSSRSSFSPRQRWQIALDMLVRTVLVITIMVMLNYLGSLFYHRFYLSSQTNVKLSTRTLAILNSLTNQLTVTLYYDTHDQENFYPTLLALANEYHAANKNISVHTVDYIADPGEAEKVKAQYNLPGAADSPNAPPNKDLIIFAGSDGTNVIPGAAIVSYQTEQMGTDNSSYDPNEKKLQFRKKPVQFNGEVMFTSKIFALTHAQPFKAYFLQGHGESSLANKDVNGYLKFGLALVQNNFTVDNLELLGDADIPMDCNLLIIAAPRKALLEPELQKIDKYLTQGGRLFMLYNFDSLNQPLGLEPILQKWGINAVPSYVKDQKNSVSDYAFAVRQFNQKSFVNPLTQLALEMVLPRPIAAVNWTNAPDNAPQADELVFSSDTSTLEGDPAAQPRSYPLIAAVAQKPIAGVVNPRGNTRIVVAGDSYFLNNQLIDVVANRDFLNYAVNWLTDREELLAGISPRPVTEYRLLLTRTQQQQLDWLLLAALPGVVLILGWFVWLVRRK